MVSTRLLFVIAILPFAISNPDFDHLVLHEHRDDIPDGFVNSGSAPADQVLNLRLGLVQGDMVTLEERLYAVSTPGSPEYGQHLSKEEVEVFVKPAADSMTLVNEWLSANGLAATTISPAGDWLSVSIPVSKASSLFDAEFSVFTHQETGQQSVLTLAYSIPAALIGHLDFVHPTITFEDPPAHLSVSSFPISPDASRTIAGINLTSRTVPATCTETITPTCLQELYGIPITPATQSSNTLGVAGFIQQFANKADLQPFLQTLRPDMPSNTTFGLRTLDGGSNSQVRVNAGINANTNIQYTVGIATGVPTTFISVGSNVNDGALSGFLDIINFVLGMSSPPHVLTTSYGQNENTISRNLANNLCNAYMQLGARGTSILFAFGDGGVSGSHSSNCTNFGPAFPSGCPFLTSVGATTGIGPEIAASFSSGGFSNYFAQPSYQASAVSSFLSDLGDINEGKFNNSGRGFPNVSAQGVNVEVVLDAEFGVVSGTPASSPIFASVIALLNDELVAAGKSPLGFLNPFLYSTGASALNDIISGSNPGCNTNGFSADTGWDPVSGLGTPDYTKLRTAAGL